jgi:uncharacterized iron-regulated membrane protein
MRFRTVVFWLHLVAGTVAGVVILIMSVTGTLLTFQQAVLLRIEWSQRIVTPPASGASRLDADVLLQRVRDRMPGVEPTGLTLAADPIVAATVAMGSAGNVFVNPYTGDVLGSGSARARAFYRSVTNWHRYLAMSGEGRATGRALTGACNAAFLVLAMSGLYLWWPRQWTRRHLAPIVWFRRGIQGKARDFNWHNVIGFWCAPVLIVLTASGMVISYPWASNLVYTLTGSPRPAGASRGAPSPAAAPGSTRTLAPPPASRTPPVPIEAIVAAGARQLPTWRVMTLRLPANASGQVSITMSDATHWNAFARSTLTLDPATAVVVRWEPYGASSLGQKVRGWLRFAHTGELGGLPGEAVAGLASAGGGFLVWTGVALALRRWSAWRERRRARVTSPTPGNASDVPEPALESGVIDGA